MYGLSIMKPDGSVWISPGFTPQCLINKGTIPATEKSFLKHQSRQAKVVFSLSEQRRRPMSCTRMNRLMDIMH